ncbi:hypothetical protein E2C01_014576 [Portunus trituberculatus]|uniref:Uncharacterized protein n=1 Tax=Portunus trituberculatus TaxID=210409 RepID=A0A5B7DJL9_PORTR|nr:hypothetical protein [Portunus trituberculatus]
MSRDTTDEFSVSSSLLEARIEAIASSNIPQIQCLDSLQKMSDDKNHLVTRLSTFSQHQHFQTWTVLGHALQS